MREKGFAPLLFILIGVVIIAAAFFAPKLFNKQAPSQISQVDQSLLVYEKNNKVFLLNGLKSKAIEIDDGNNPSLSSDRTKIAYVKMDKDNNIHIFNIATGKKESITTDAGRLRAVQWSPDSKYLITDSGSSPDGSGAVYEYHTGVKKGATFSISQGRLMWINNNEFVYEEPQTVSPERPYESGMGFGLSKITVGGDKQMLVQANGTDNYNLLEIKNGIIYFSKTTATNNDWENQDNLIDTYWKMNADGSGKVEVDKPEILSDKVSAVIPQQYSGYDLFGSPDINNGLANWVVFELNNGGSVYNDLICIVNLDDPQNSFRQITVGDSPEW